MEGEDGITMEQTLRQENITRGQCEGRNQHSGLKILAFTRESRAKQLRQKLDEEKLDFLDTVHDTSRDRRAQYGAMDVITSLSSIVFYILDIVLEARLAVYYYQAYLSLDGSEPTINDDCLELPPPSPSSYLIWFHITLCFMIIPGFICGLCSLSWHISDFKVRRKLGPMSTGTYIRYIFRFIMPLLLLGPVLHNCEAILYGISAMKITKQLRKNEGDEQKKENKEKLQKFLFEQALFEDADAALLRIMECFLESLPQLILQMHIVMVSANFGVPLSETVFRPDVKSNMTDNSSLTAVMSLPLCSIAPHTLEQNSTKPVGNDPFCRFFANYVAEWFPWLPSQVDCQLALQLVTMIATLLAAAWALVSYQKTLRRFVFARKLLLFWPSGLFLFLAHSFLLSGRVLAIVLFTQVFGFYLLLIVLGVHTAVMFLWLQFGSTCRQERKRRLPAEFCCADSILVRSFFNLVLALIYTSAYINIFETPSRKRYAFFFAITLFENICFIILWFFITTSVPTFTDYSFLTDVLITGLVLVFGGVALLFSYYKFFHPNVFHANDDSSTNKIIKGTE